MLRKFTKLLAALSVLILLAFNSAFNQCALITDNYSGQSPSSVCAPVDMTMDVRYKFLVPMDPDKVEILYIWNDGTGATTLLPAISTGDTVFTASAMHTYPPSSECSYTAEAYVVYDGVQCTSSSRQEQTFSAWARDNENGGIIITDPVVAQFCEGEDIVNMTFEDNSTFNCNIGVEPDKPNRITRWVQFIYGTTTISGERIPNVSVSNGMGNTYQLTDASGNSLGPVAGPIVEIDVPADGPNQISWFINAPAGGVAGDIFEITMRNWNICNAYDNNPFDSIPPVDTIDGDNEAITTTALIEIITTPPVIINPSLEFCVDNPINLTLSTSGGDVTWYSDSLLTDIMHTGNSFDPTGPPTFIDNSVSGKYSYYVTESIGACESAPSKITFEIFDTPIPPADAGFDTVLCADTYKLEGNTPVIGTGVWTTTSGATIVDPLDPNSQVTNLDPGPNMFRWIIENGPCSSIDEVIITRDLQPGVANAGINQSFCDNSSAILNAAAATNNGIGIWSILAGSASFSDINDPQADITNIEGGGNILLWTVTSLFGACATSSDTVEILRDVTPDPANAGIDRGVCDSTTIQLNGNPVTGGGTGMWSVLSGSAMVTDTGDPNSEVTGLTYGLNSFLWEINSQYGICAGSSDVVNITRDQNPDPAFAGTDQLLCNTVSMPLGANPASVGTGEWSVVTNPSGVPPEFIPSVNNENATVQILPGNEGIYEFSWTITNESCITSDTIRIDFGITVPPADAGNDDSVCGNSANLIGNTPPIGVGTWLKISGSGDVSFIPGENSPIVLAVINSGEEGLYEFEWEITSGSCPPTADTVAVMYLPQPGMPNADGAALCGPGSVILTSAIGLNGNTNHWYESAFGDNVLSESTDYTTPVLGTSTSYWLATYNDTTECESNRVKVDVIINPVPEVPYADDIDHCGADSVLIDASIGTNGTTNNWYNASTGGSLLGSSEDYITPYLTGSESFWVSSYNSLTTCESPRIQVDVNINPIPGIPGGNDLSICGAGTMALVSTPESNSTTNRWYDSQLNGTLLDTGLIFNTPFLTSTVSYWVSGYNSNTNCESDREEIKAIVYPVPGLPTVNDVSNCGPGNLVLSSLPGSDATTGRWYDSITDGNLLDESNIFTTPWLDETEKYYVSSYNDITGCQSSRIEIQAVILPEPALNPIQGADQVGQGQSNAIYSVYYNPGSTYIWNIPAGITVFLENQNFVILEFPNLGIYNISVTEVNSIGCPGPESIKQIEVLEDLLYVNLNIINGNMCVGEEMQILALPAGGTPSYTFSWTGDIDYLSATDVSNPVFNPATPGTYNLYIEVTDINLNKVNDSLTITAFSNPFTDIFTSDTITCTGEDLQLSTFISGGSGNYTTCEWTGQTTPLSRTDIRNPVFNTIIKGTYFLKFTVFDDNGCQAEDSVNIINDRPESAFTSDAVPQCSPVTFNFSNSSEGAVSYEWNFGDGYSSDLENPSYEFLNLSSTIGYYNVKLTAYSEYGCSHNSNEYVTVYPNPDNSIDIEPEVACNPADVLLFAKPGGFKYNWDFGDGEQDEGSYNIIHTFTNDAETDTVYEISLVTTSSFNCLDTSHAYITVYPSPVAEFTASPVHQMYPDRTVDIVNNTEDNNWNYEWYFGDEGTSYERDPGSHEYSAPDDYTISLVVKGEHCSDSATANIEIVPHPPVAKFKPVEPGCMPLTIHFKNTSSYSTGYLWEFGDGAVSNRPNPVYTYYEPGQYKIRLTATGEGGSDTYNTVNDVYIMPNAYFNLAPRYVFVDDETVHFFNLSDNSDIYEWDFGDGTKSTEFNPKHVYKKEGVYDVTLCVWTDHDCFDLYIMENAVFVEPSGKIIYPNAFRPESMLEENRVFKPAVIDQVDEYHLMVFNRWGEMIFESYYKDMGWDGYVDDKIAKQDVYVWKVEGKYSNGKAFIDTGDVTLLR
jgi:PKD repeat protein